jgi:hypothetical protein
LRGVNSQQTNVTTTILVSTRDHARSTVVLPIDQDFSRPLLIQSLMNPCSVQGLESLSWDSRINGKPRMFARLNGEALEVGH